MPLMSKFLEEVVMYFRASRFGENMWIQVLWVLLYNAMRDWFVEQKKLFNKWIEEFYA